jgi:hypothetical protein
MYTRYRVVPVVALLVGACVSEDRIDHVYDREERLEDRRHAHDLELVDRLFAHAHRLVDHGFDRQEQVFERFDEFAPAGFEPAGFGPSTCRFESTPSGAEVWELDFFDEWAFVGRTPLVVERPLMHSRKIEVRLAGHASASGHMMSDEVHSPCEEHFVLAPTTEL